MSEVRVASDNVFGSDELTPELLRAATFVEQDGRYDAAEVRTFLDRVASSLDVFLSADAPSALRAEFARNAEIAQQVLDAGQTASAHVRQQAGEDAHRILEETREATDRLRDEVEAEIARSREQVEGMRGQFIQDLRDLYDRIGASLYRFERAAEESHVAPIAEPGVQGVSGGVWNAAPASEFSAPAGEPPIASALPDPPPVAVQDPADVELPEGAKPPAWQQLPPEAWAGAPGSTEATGPAAFAVEEDEPLAPGEPLVDLRELQPPAEPETAATAASDAGSWLAGADPTGTTDPEPAGLAPTEAEPVVEVAAPLPGDAGGSWLADATADVAGRPIPDPLRAHDDALAEALISGTPFGEEPTATEPASQQPLADPGAEAAASADAVAVRQLILDSLAQGQTRAAVEAYLRDQMGFMEPGTLVDAALGTAGQA